MQHVQVYLHKTGGEDMPVWVNLPHSLHGRASTSASTSTSSTYHGGSPAPHSMRMKKQNNGTSFDQISRFCKLAHCADLVMSHNPHGSLPGSRANEPRSPPTSFVVHRPSEAVSAERTVSSGAPGLPSISYPEETPVQPPLLQAARIGRPRDISQSLILHLRAFQPGR